MSNLKQNHLVALVLGAGMAFAAVPSFAAESVDVGEAVLQTKDIKEGLFPDDECEQLKAAGFKCMGFKPAVRFSLPAIAFGVGSAELPDLLKRQLDAFADVLKTRPANSHKVRVEGHADASGAAAVNLELSQRRAESARKYLISKGVSAELLTAVGMGSKEPKNAAAPLAADNRRVVIGREPDAAAAPSASAPAH